MESSHRGWPLLDTLTLAEALPPFKVLANLLARFGHVIERNDPVTVDHSAG